jgi:hypothetical protein
MKILSYVRISAVPTVRTNVIVDNEEEEEEKNE